MSNASELKTAPELTEEQLDAIYEWATKHGRDRARAQGSEFREEDFLAGAMVAFFACRSQGKIPGGWIFGLMAGDSPLGLDTAAMRKHRQAVKALPKLLSALQCAGKDLAWLRTEADHRSSAAFTALMDALAEATGEVPEYETEAARRELEARR